MQASVILPFISVLALLVGAIFHIEIKEDVQLQIAEVIAGLVATVFVIRGIIQNHKKETPK